MTELRPAPFAELIRRAFNELERSQSIFDLPQKNFVGDPGVDLSVAFHHHRPSSPLGPAAGPHTQMAQNLVLAWLAGCRIFELKTVQVMDELEIPRPCIDLRTVGFNVEWSQELRLEQSLEEYVKGIWLIEMLRQSGMVPVAEGFERSVFDLSVGYDLEGIRGERVGAFFDGMMDCRAEVDRLRRQIPPELAHLADVELPAKLADTLTLSTFHGCPPTEIESILRWLMQERGLSCIVKLNPTLLGPKRCRELLNDRLGYHHLKIPDAAFEEDVQWSQAIDIVGRLRELAASLGLDFGVKLSNTLIVENPGDFLPASEERMYLSGPPLHVLAMNLVKDFREAFGAELPISFSAGIDSRNFAQAVALGLTPITVCTDLLKPGGYARAARYTAALTKAMTALEVDTIEAYILASAGDAGSLDEAILGNTVSYVEGLEEDPRYGWEKNAKKPKKVGSELELFDCLSCNKCVPVCPNDANFVYEVEQREVPIRFASKVGEDWSIREDGVLEIAKSKQWANFADFCNECGNCDVFCPEDGGPYAVKPRFFRRVEDWRQLPDCDGFALDGERFHGRIDGIERSIEGDQTVSYRGPGFSVRLQRDDPSSLAGVAEGEIDLTWLDVLLCLREAVYRSQAPNPLNSHSS